MLRVLVLLVFFATSHTWGQSVAPDVSVSQLNAAVEKVSAQLPADDPQRVSLLKSYEDTRAALAGFEQYNQQFKSFALSRSNAREEAAAIEKKLTVYQNAPEQDYKVSRSLSLPELEQMIQIDKSELEAKKSQLADISAAIDELPGRPTAIHKRVTELDRLVVELKAQQGLLNQKVKSGGSDEAALWLASAQLASFNAEKAALKEEILSLPVRLELLKAQSDEASYDIAAEEKKLRAMALRAGELREGEAAQAQAAADLILMKAQGKHELIQQMAGRNAELTKTFGQLSEEIGEANRQADLIRGKAEQLEADLTEIERKLEILGMSAAVGRILRERQAQLPTDREIAKKISTNEYAIRDSSLRQVELEDERRLLRNRSEYVKQLLLGVEPEVAKQISDDLKELVLNRRELLRKAVDLDNTYAQQLGDLDFTLRRYEVAVEDYRHFISARLLWIPTRQSLGILQGEGAELLNQMREVFAPSRWVTVVQGMPEELLAQPLVGVTLLLVLLLVYFDPRLKQLLEDTGKHVGYVRSDRFASTLQALCLSLLLSLKWPLLMLATAWLFEMQDKESELATALYAALVRNTVYFLGLEFLRITLRPKGLIDRHFRWPTSRVTLIGRRIVSLELTLLPAVFLVSLFINLYPRDVGGSLGTIAVILVLLSIAQFFRHLPAIVPDKVQMIFRDKASTESPLWGKLIRTLLYWIPLAAILAVFLGYTFTAIEMALLLIRTFVLLSVLLVFHELGLRWLGLTHNRMAFKVRQEQAKASQQEGEITAEDELLESDPKLLSEEGRKLVNLLTLFGGLLGVAWIWAEVFPALSILDSVNLWHQTAIVEGQEVAAPVTLSDLLQSLIIATVGWVALRRIPGLLEIILRQRANVSAATAYAITRVFQYASTALLLVFVAGSLGGSWSSMQWAVAALSLGIGFGLQEIVANFISGLIILFEQPIRVGDVVTVGDVSGTVTRIQMRATTIRDFDRRELLVPNKEFITSQLLNWSLSDSVTRRLIQVGVAYGSNMDEALDIVRDVAKKHSLVLADPQPMITFDEFGESSLLISLRYFIENLDQRMQVDSELRLDINRRFNAAGIVVAFPQRDIHLDMAQPLEIRMMDSRPAVKMP